MQKKNIFKCILLIITSFVIISCEEDISGPNACYSLSIRGEGEDIILESPYIVPVGTEINFINCGKADYYAFFPGDSDENWKKYSETGEIKYAGLDTNENGNVTYTYRKAGKFTATMVLTNRKVSDPKNYKQSTLDVEITITE